jgi:hypothetical protein|uniref:Uncharacterized protein n=1 Tax=Myoviridae sp. ctshb19 TaxID=2825194 RepID=A0A8S5UGQ8_9CAUD|nr:MAG TPA: hypothetical protein [Myoviridae sp. ctshb19]
MHGKIFGARLSITYEGQTKIHTNWYSHDEQEALASLERAKAIAPPANCTVTWELVSDDVRLISTGVYRTDKKRLVEIYEVGPFTAHGCFLKPNRQREISGHCHFYTNGDPVTHQKLGRLLERVS